MKRELFWLGYIFLISFIFFGILTDFDFNGSLDIAIHDTYYVVANAHLWIFGFCMLFFGNLLFLFNASFFPRRKWLKILILSLAGVFCLFTMLPIAYFLFAILILIPFNEVPGNIKSSFLILVFGLILLLGLRLLEYIRANRRKI